MLIWPALLARNTARNEYGFMPRVVRGRVVPVDVEELRGRDEADDRLGGHVRKLGFPSDDRLGFPVEVDDGSTHRLELNREGRCKLWRDW